MTDYQILTGDCIDRLAHMENASVDAVVTDPPYGLSFMGKAWDHAVPGVGVWKECLRVLKPGGHLLAFAGTRTQHRMATAIEDAGFEIRDMIGWIYGSGFPKSHDVAKGIDKTAGVKREVLSERPTQVLGDGRSMNGHAEGATWKETRPATDAAAKWEGWGTALKPALEPITVARKPLGGTVAANVLKHGTGALNVDMCRIEGGSRHLVKSGKGSSVTTFGDGLNGGWSGGKTTQGRWPANLIHDGSADCLNQLRGAARFFYCAKASKADRNEGLGDFAPRAAPAAKFRPNHAEGAAAGESGNPYGRWQPKANNHPTVKPTNLMRYLCRLVTPPGGIVLDPFAGSGSTGKGAILEGFRFVGIEADEDHVAIAKARIAAVEPQPWKRDAVNPADAGESEETATLLDIMRSETLEE